MAAKGNLTGGGEGKGGKIGKETIPYFLHNIKGGEGNGVRNCVPRRNPRNGNAFFSNHIFFFFNLYKIPTRVWPDSLILLNTAK